MSIVDHPFGATTVSPPDGLLHLFFIFNSPTSRYYLGLDNRGAVSQALEENSWTAHSRCDSMSSISYGQQVSLPGKSYLKLFKCPLSDVMRQLFAFPSFRFPLECQTRFSRLFHIFCLAFRFKLYFFFHFFMFSSIPAKNFPTIFSFACC